MARKITLTTNITRDELVHEIKTTRDGRYRLRLQAVMLAMDGLIALAITTQLLIDRKSLFRWVKLFNKDGLDGLKNFCVGGKPKGKYYKWDEDIFTALFEKLDSMDEFYSVPKMQSWIADNYGVTIPQNTIHQRLRDNGYTFKSSRPNPYKGDPNLQASFKKTV